MDEAYCPNCGTLLHPQSWMQTWGVVLLLVGGAVGLIGLFIVLRNAW